MRSEIQQLLESDLTTRELSRKSGVNVASISLLRTGQKALGKISLEVAEKLYKIYEEIDTMNKVEQIRERLEDTDNSYYIEEYANLNELIEYFQENNEDFNIEDLKDKSSKIKPEIRHNVALVTFDNPNTDLFEWAYLDKDVESIVNTLRNY
ncbi:hypothetical protein ERX37_05415 [Macrococcus hajekii]|uniref:Uncharacterized protein n=1 Tax=Macrococcus hajekii TaxID=198482 RepID=A0A4R6BNS0_9STAP|nr:hypothetical protein [Macrococcus hajekii]TDM03524.1 hypothetical protein ERX37_05415 [Macrococcus hajekii]GGA99527.1 hypothetical protein GCM10007190_04490 [Macrococcus hajekii]